MLSYLDSQKLFENSLSCHKNANLPLTLCAYIFRQWILCLKWIYSYIPYFILFLLFAFSPKCFFSLFYYYFYKAQKIYLMLYWNLLSCLYLTKPFCLRLRYAFFKLNSRKICIYTLFIHICAYITKEILEIPSFGNFFPSNFTFGPMHNNAVSANEFFSLSFK